MTATTAPSVLSHTWLSGDPATVYLARSLTDEACADWSLGHLQGDARLLGSELVNNAVAETPGCEVRMWVVREAQTLLIKVWDSSPRLPVSRAAEDHEETGRGLVIVSALCGPGQCGANESPGAISCGEAV